MFQEVIATVRSRHPEIEVVDRWPDKASEQTDATEERKEQIGPQALGSFHTMPGLSASATGSDHPALSETETLCGDKAPAVTVSQRELKGLNFERPGGWRKPLQPRRACKRAQTPITDGRVQSKRKGDQKIRQPVTPKKAKTSVHPVSLRPSGPCKEDKVTPTFDVPEPRLLHSYSASRTASADLEVPEIVFSDVKKMMKDIDRFLWPAVKTAFDASGLSWHSSAKIAIEPSTELNELYEICFGTNWDGAIVGLVNQAAFQSVDVFVALIGAAIDSHVFKPSLPWEDWDVFLFPTGRHREIAAEYLKRKGVLLEEFGRYIDVHAKDQSFVASHIRPQARRLALNLNNALCEHLSEQASTTSCHRVDALPSQMTNAIIKALEIAILLKTRLRANGEDVGSGWYLPGTKFASGTMVEGSHAKPYVVNKGRIVAFTLLPRIDLFCTSEDDWQVASEAFVAVRPGLI